MIVFLIIMFVTAAGEILDSPDAPPQQSDHDSDSSVFDAIKSPTSHTSIDQLEQVT